MHTRRGIINGYVGDTALTVVGVLHLEVITGGREIVELSLRIEWSIVKLRRH